MCLKLDGVRAASGDRIHIGVRRAQAAVVRLRYFSDYQTALWIEQHV
jgi:hypothetical protein